jgi:hypothetical protein
LKSVIVDISKPIPGGSRWMNASLGTMLKLWSKPPGIGLGEPTPAGFASADSGSSSVMPASPPNAIPPPRSTCRRENPLPARAPSGRSFVTSQPSPSRSTHFRHPATGS